MITSLLVLALALIQQDSALQQLLTHSRSTVKWDSRIHNHLYESAELEAAIDLLTNQLIADPQSFQRSIQGSDRSTREALAADPTDSRIDFIDLLSVRLKQRLQERWKAEGYESSIPYDRPELWSLSKSKWRSLLLPEVHSSSQFSFFREVGRDAKEAIFVCTDSSKFDTQPIDSWSVAGIQFYRLRLSNRTILQGQCGNDPLSLSTEAFPPPPDYEIPLSSKPVNLSSPDHLHVLVTIGLVSTLKDFQVKMIAEFMKWIAGYQKRSEQVVQLRDELQNQLLTTDLLLHVIDLPHANHFGFFSKAETGLRLDFERKISQPLDSSKDLMIHLTILLPPLRNQTSEKERRDGRGVTLTLAEVSELISKRIQSRGRSFGLIDLTCFSQRNIKEWMMAQNLGHSKAKKISGPQPFPLIFASSGAQQGEALVEIINEVASGLRLIEMIATNQSIETMRSDLESPSFLSRFIYYALYPLKWFMHWNPPHGFQLVTNAEPPFDELAKPTLKSVHIIQGRSLRDRRIFGPILN